MLTKEFFKILLKGIKKQINFLVDEDLTPGANGTHVKGAIGVISMLHYCFENLGPVKKNVIYTVTMLQVRFMKFREQD